MSFILCASIAVARRMCVVHVREDCLRMRVKSVTRQSGTMKQKGSRTRQCAVYARALRIASFLFARSSLFPAGHRAANSPLPCSALPPPPSLSSPPTSSPYPRRDHQKKRGEKEKSSREKPRYTDILHIHPIVHHHHHHHHRRRLDPCAPTVTRPTLTLRPSQISPPATEREGRRNSDRHQE